MKDRIAHSVAWLVWSRGFVQGVSLVTTILVARLLSPADYGLMALATIWTGTLALVGELGLGAAIVQFPDLEEGELNVCFWLAQGVAGIGYLALYAAAPSVASWFGTPPLADILRVAGVTLPLAALRLVPESLLRKRLALDRLSQVEILAVLATLPVVLSLAWMGMGVWALVAGALVMPFVQNLGAFWCAGWLPGLRMRSRRRRALLRYSLTSLGARASWAAYEQVDTFVLGKIAGEVVLGFYSMAKALASLPVVKISVVVNQLAVPVMAGLQADRDGLQASFLRGLRFVAALTVPLCVGLALVADDFVAVVLGAKWQPIAPLLRVLAIFGLIHSLDALLPPVLFARYRPGLLFRCTVALLVVMPFAFWAGAVWMGALGVALAWIAVYPLVMAWMARESLAELRLGWRTVWAQLRPPCIAALPMAGCVVLVRSVMPATDIEDRFARLLLASGLGAAVYARWLLWRGGPVVAELMEIAGWLFGRRPSESGPAAHAEPRSV